MRAFTGLSVAVVAIGCGGMMTESRGVTRKECEGTQTVVFTNASPATMCGLFMTNDGNGKYGDNWLPAEGLATGKSLEFKIKPGKYKATWNTCKEASKPYFAGTLTHETAIDVKDATQLFAFVADTVAPTKRAAPKEFHKLVKFPGQEIGGVQVAATPAPAVPTEPVAEAEIEKVDMSGFIDATAVRMQKAGWTKTGAKSNAIVTPKASLKRAHDVSSARVGYVEKR